MGGVEIFLSGMAAGAFLFKRTIDALEINLIQTDAEVENNEEKKERSLHGQSIGRSDSGRAQSAEWQLRICTASQQLAHRYREKMAVVTPNQRECGCSTGFRPF